MLGHSPNILPYFSRTLGYFFMWIIFMWMPLILVGATNPHLILLSRCTVEILNASTLCDQMTCPPLMRNVKVEVKCSSYELQLDG